MWQDRGPLRINNQMGSMPTPSQQPKNKKGFWMDQISTGGGIGGALAGAAGGAAIGSVVPVVGTAVGGILGALIGGGLGSAGGEFAENVITKEDDLGKNVLQEGLIGGVTSLPIGAGLKLANAGIKAGSRGALGVGSKTAGELVQEAGVQTIGRRQLGGIVNAGRADQGALDAIARLQTPKPNRLGARLEDTGARMLNSQSNITAAQARNAGINTTETFGNINARTGLTRLDDMAEVGRGLTGSGDQSLLDTITRAAIQEAPGVAVGDLRKQATALIDDGASLITEAQRKQVLNNVKNASVAMFGGSKGSLSNLANPSAALDQANAFRATARDLSNNFNVTPAQKQLAKVYNGLADTIEQGIYSAPGVSKSLPTLVKAGADDLLLRAKDLRAAGQGAQATAFERIAKELSQVKSVSDLRKMKRDFVNIGKIDTLTAQADGARSINGQDLTKKAGEIVRNPFNLVALPLDAATPAIAGVATRAGRAMQTPGAPRAVGQGIAGLTARQAIGRAVVPSEGSQAVTDPTMADALMQAPAEPQFTSNFGLEAPQQQAPAMGYSSQQLGQALMAAYAAGDAPAVEQLTGMFELAQMMEEQQAGGGMDLNATARASLATSGNAINTLDQLEGLFNSAGGGSGRIAGSLANFGADLGFNNPVQAYNNLSASSVSQLAKAINGGGQVSDADAAALLSALPLVTDSPEVAQTKFNALRNRLSVAQQNTLSFGGGAGGGQDILSALQGAGF